MRLLLDTHIFLWFISGDERLPDSLKSRVRDGGNEVYLSAVSIWEAVVKHQLGKLPLPAAPGRYLPEQRERHRIASLAVDEASIAQLERLPPLHNDPFDRLLVCQALHHELTLVSVDEALRGYPVEVMGRS